MFLCIYSYIQFNVADERIRVQNSSFENIIRLRYSEMRIFAVAFVAFWHVG